MEEGATDIRASRIPKIDKIIKNKLSTICKIFLSIITDKIVLRPFFDFTSTFIIFWWARRDSNS